MPEHISTCMGSACRYAPPLGRLKFVRPGSGLGSEGSGGGSAGKAGTEDLTMKHVCYPERSRYSLLLPKGANPGEDPPSRALGVLFSSFCLLPFFFLILLWLPGLGLSAHADTRHLEFSTGKVAPLPKPASERVSGSPILPCTVSIDVAMTEMASAEPCPDTPGPS